MEGDKRRLAQAVVAGLLASFAGNAVQVARSGEIGLYAASLALVTMCSLMAALPFVTGWVAERTVGRKEAREAMEERKPLDMDGTEMHALLVGAERYYVGRGNYASREFAEALLRNVGAMNGKTKYVIARDIKRERQTCARLAAMDGRPNAWQGDAADAWDALYAALGQDVLEDYS